MKPHGTLGFEIRELSILIGRYIEKEELGNDLAKMRGPQAWALGFLSENRDREIYQKDLEKELSIRKPTASRLVDRMEKNGFITTVVSAKDKRFKQIIITEKALENMKKVESFVSNLEARLTQNISEEELRSFIDTIGKLKKNIQS
ncbi:MarR family winged helix-turn-helix transcriptional regulator [Enterococcus sp. BWR-S5]|uniref:MarR family winged helix-turn-helix transcriptional regulator n=1 Tax=Enterococcus sp. BWR-S5 TaxID=2787714 RepID=UPI001F012AC5|nr:MarR family transcriptional regulator [Enterococcus sp. BWR-S5]